MLNTVGCGNQHGTFCTSVSCPDQRMNADFEIKVSTLIRIQVPVNIKEHFKLQTRIYKSRVIMFSIKGGLNTVVFCSCKNFSRSIFSFLHSASSKSSSPPSSLSDKTFLPLSSSSLSTFFHLPNHTKIIKRASCRHEGTIT